MSDLKRSDPSHLQTFPIFSQAPGLVPAWTLVDGGEYPLASVGALDQTNPNRWGTDAGTARTRDAGPGSAREFPQFEHGSGI